MTTNTKLSPADARRLNAFLQSDRVPEGTLNLSALKGFLFCVCTTPAPLQPNIWLPLIFGGSGQMPIFQGDEDARLLNLIMRLYHQINQEILDGTPKLPAGTRLDPDFSKNFEPGNPLHDWSYGFDWGLGHTLEIWENVPLDQMDLKDDIATIWMACTYFSDEKRARDVNPRIVKKSALIEFAQNIRLDLPHMIRDYAHIARSLFDMFLHMRDHIREEHGEEFADDIFDEEYEEEDPSIRRQRLRQILQEEPENTEAMVALSEVLSDPKDRIELMQKALQLEEKKLGQKYFEENEGYFWSEFETRTYMRALSNLGLAYRDARQPVKAIECFQKTLALNPSDHQGNRFPLLSLFLENQRMADADWLLDEYYEDQSTYMLFAHLLVSYIREGDNEHSRELRRRANAQNEHIAKYLNNQLKMPNEIPEYYGQGDHNEAIFYCKLFRDAWRQTVGAIPWLLKKD